MPNCDFNKVAKHGYSPVNLLHSFRTPFLKNTSGGLLLITGRITEYLEKLTQQYEQNGDQNLR